MSDQETAALAKTEGVRRKRFMDEVRTKIPGIKPDLCLFTPTEVRDALKGNKDVISWHKWLAEEYTPPKHEIALLFPDSDRKPWTKGKTTDHTYKNLYIALKSLNLEKRVHILTVSTVFGIIPEERFEDMPLYDSSGMFSWSVRQKGMDWDAMVFKEVLMDLGTIVSGFVQKNKDIYTTWVAVYRAPSVHERIIEYAYDLAPFKLEQLKTKKPLSSQYSILKDMLKKIV